MPSVLIAWTAYSSGTWRSATGQEQLPSGKRQRLLETVEPSLLRQLGIAVCLTAGNGIATSLTRSPKSTYICETLSAVPSTAIALQFASVVLDICIIISIQGVLGHLGRSGSSRSQHAPLLFGFLLLVSTKYTLGKPSTNCLDMCTDHPCERSYTQNNPERAGFSGRLRFGVLRLSRMGDSIGFLAFSFPHPFGKFNPRSYKVVRSFGNADIYEDD